MRVASIGECMIELAFADRDETTARVGFSGDTYNTAVYLKRGAGAAATVSYVTALGTDTLSDRMCATFAAEGLATDLIERRRDRVPGLYAISVDDEGERSFTYWRDASAARTLFARPGSVMPDRLAGFDLIYLSGITLAILTEAARADLTSFLVGYRHRGGRVAFDSNYRARLWPDADAARRVIGALWRLTDIALPSLDDEMLLWGDADAQAVRTRLTDAGVTDGAIKRGAAGPLPMAWQGPLPDFPPAERIVDTTAAGDSFNGAYLAAWLAGADPPACLSAGHAMAAHVIGFPGAIVPR